MKLFPKTMTWQDIRGKSGRTYSYLARRQRRCLGWQQQSYPQNRGNGIKSRNQYLLQRDITKGSRSLMSFICTYILMIRGNSSRSIIVTCSHNLTIPNWKVSLPKLLARKYLKSSPGLLTAHPMLKNKWRMHD
jgi:hypothetical protein